MDDIEFKPLTHENWDDLALFFEQHANPNYCWCMRWRLSSREFKASKSIERRNQLKRLVQKDVPVGVLGYHRGEVVGWCSIAPRETFTLLENSTTLKRLDDQSVWCVVCFFVDSSMRGRGFSLELLQAAVNYALSQGAAIIEGYPVEPERSYRFMGSPVLFEQAGFRPAGYAKNGRIIARFYKDIS